jgi:antitoxin component YwqK of YwqJK toxin-antitoxin module
MKKSILLSAFFVLVFTGLKAQSTDVNINDKGKFTNVFGDLFTGNVTYYYETGNIESTYEVTDGTKDGKMTVYYINGAVRESGSFNDGHKTGEWFSYSVTGQLESIAFYKNDRKHGTWKTFDEKGNLLEQVTY